MDHSSMRPLFRAEVMRLAAQIEPWHAVLSEGKAPQRTLMESLQRRWLALKSAAVVVRSNWLEVLADKIDFRLRSALERGASVDPSIVHAMQQALRLATDFAVTAVAADDSDGANDALWQEANEKAAVDSRQLLGVLGVRRQSASVQIPAIHVAPEVSSADVARMHTLLKQEVEEQTAEMQRLLLDLDGQPDQTRLIEPLLRATHSLKGAARAARVAPAVQLAHEFENSLAALLRGDLSVSPVRIDLFLRVVDHLAVLVNRDDAVGMPCPDEATERLLARMADEQSAHSVVTEGEEFAKAPNSTAGGPAPGDTGGAPVEVSGAGEPAGAARVAGSRADAVLKVSAQSVDAMLGLAAQQLVEVDGLRQLQAESRELRADARRLHEALEGLHGGLRGMDLPAHTITQIAALRAQLMRTRQRLHLHVDNLHDTSAKSEQLVQRLYRMASQVRLRPLRDRLVTLPRMVRDLARQLGKSVQFEVSGDSAMLDRDILNHIEAPLTHLLRNALDHGVETPAQRLAAGKPERALLALRARHHAGMLLIEVSDDGRGIDTERIRDRVRSLRQASRVVHDADALSREELLETLFEPGVSMSERVTEISGRGVGLDVVRTNLHEIDGSVRITTRAGCGTTFHLLVPTSRVVVRTVVVDVSGERYGFPLARIGRLVRIGAQALAGLAQDHYTHVDGASLRLFGLAALLELGDIGGTPGRDAIAVVIEHHGSPWGFVADRVLGEFDLSVRPLDSRLGRVCDVSAAAVMPDGEPIVLLDIDDLLRSAQRQQGGIGCPRPLAQPLGSSKRVLVADDSLSVRELQRQLLVQAGYSVDLAVDGLDAWQRVREQDYDLLVTDVDMPRMDGFMLTRSVKQDPKLRNLPVMIVSYRDQPDDRERGLDARADCYVTKSDFQEQRFLDLARALLPELTCPGSIKGERA